MPIHPTMPMLIYEDDLSIWVSSDRFSPYRDFLSLFPPFLCISPRLRIPCS